MVLLHQAEEQSAKETAERLRRAVENETIALLHDQHLHCQVRRGESAIGGHRG
jgi:GGDEF domain-containing protein